MSDGDCICVLSCNYLLFSLLISGCRFFSRFVKAAVITTSLACAASINIQAANAQSARQTTAPSSTVTGDFNNVIQVPNQNNAQSSNTNNPVFNNISPLQTPANSEDDLSFNVSVGFFSRCDGVGGSAVSARKDKVASSAYATPCRANRSAQDTKKRSLKRNCSYCKCRFKPQNSSFKYLERQQRP